mgnify:FL=1
MCCTTPPPQATDALSTQRAIESEYEIEDKGTTSPKEERHGIPTPVSSRPVCTASCIAARISLTCRVTACLKGASQD